MSEAVRVQKQLDKWLNKAKASISDFSRKDRKRLMRKAARPIATEARKVLESTLKTPMASRKVHYRGRKPDRIKYNPGNLGRSLKHFTFRRSQDIFVGPRFARKKSKSYGGPGQPSDGYYAAMVHGSSAAFRRKVLDVAAAKAGPRALGRVKGSIRKAILEQARKRGIKVAA